MDVAKVRTLVTNLLPVCYEPLQLTFYGQRARRHGGYVVIGDDYGTELRVRLSDGAVYSIDPDSQLPVRFVNSGIEQLAKFIQLYRSSTEAATSDTDTATLARQMRARLALLDPPVFDNSENWWAVVLEQAEDGLL